MSYSGAGDLVRAVAVLAGAVLQAAFGALGGSGALMGESVGAIARSYPNPLLPAGAAFMIWNVVYVAVFALAVWQLLPSQRGRDVHRRTGWAIAAVCVLNAAWVLLFSADQVAASQIVIVALLLTLVVVWRRTASEGGDRRQVLLRRWLLWGPMSLYTGWVGVATVVGALTTVAAVGAGGVATAVAIVALIATAVAVVWVVAAGFAVAAFAAAAIWALTWIAVDAAPAVAGVAAAVVLLIAATLVLRLVRAEAPARVAFG